MKARFILSMAMVLSCASGVAAADTRNPLADSATWDSLSFDIIGDAQPLDGAGIFTLEAPYRANDAATVPVTIVQDDLSVGAIDKVTLVVDENPAPVAAIITFGPAMAPLKFETRVRVNLYSNIRVIAEAPDGTFMDGRFVKASGGCSAPATRVPAAALAEMGQMRLKHYGDAPLQSGVRREAQLMLRHPNYSGLQRDQLTQLFVPAHFISKLEVFQGDEMLFTLEGGISISENPVFRFDYTDNGSTALRVRAEDTEGNVFEREMEKQPSI